MKSNNTFIFLLWRWRFDFFSVGLQEVCCTVEPHCREMISDEFRHCDILRSHSFHCVTFFQHHVLQFGKTLKWRCGVYPQGPLDSLRAGASTSPPPGNILLSPMKSWLILWACPITKLWIQKHNFQKPSILTRLGQTEGNQRWAALLHKWLSELYKVCFSSLSLPAPKVEPSWTFPALLAT